jgi:hypothetical protein
LVEPANPTPVSSSAEDTMAFSRLLRFGTTKALFVTTGAIFNSS